MRPQSNARYPTPSGSGVLSIRGLSVRPRGPGGLTRDTAVRGGGIGGPFQHLLMRGRAAPPPLNPAGKCTLVAETPKCRTKMRELQYCFVKSSKMRVRFLCRRHVRGAVYETALSASQVFQSALLIAVVKPPDDLGREHLELQG